MNTDVLALENGTPFVCRPSKLYLIDDVVGLKQLVSFVDLAGSDLSRDQTDDRPEKHGPIFRILFAEIGGHGFSKFNRLICGRFAELLQLLDLVRGGCEESVQVGEFGAWEFLEVTCRPENFHCLRGGGGQAGRGILIVWEFLSSMGAGRMCKSENFQNHLLETIWTPRGTSMKIDIFFW